MAVITVTCHEDGETVEVAVRGEPGQGCVKLTEDLNKALGEVVSSRKTAEYHQVPAQKQKVVVKKW